MAIVEFILRIGWWVRYVAGSHLRIAFRRAFVCARVRIRDSGMLVEVGLLISGRIYRLWGQV